MSVRNYINSTQTYVWTDTPIIRWDNSFSITDVTDGRESDNPLDLVKMTASGGFINGYYSESQRFVNVPAVIPPNRQWTAAYQSESADALRASNLANPGRPEILLPVFLTELRDIPKMVRQLGDTLRFIHNRIKRPSFTIASDLPAVKRLAADNLAYQFGWAPLVSDLNKMFQFTESVKKRSLELTRLHSEGGLKRRIKIDDRSWSTFETIDILRRNNVVLQVNNVKVTRTFRRWATVRMVPTSDSPLPTDNARIRNMLTGLTLGALGSNIWEAIPWSWLVDYFSNLGDIVDSANNSAFVRRTSLNVMTHTSNSFLFPAQTRRYAGIPPKFTENHNSRFEVLYERKQRYLGIQPNFPLNAGLPLLGAGQLSILGSLAITRMVK